MADEPTEQPEDQAEPTEAPADTPTAKAEDTPVEVAQETSEGVSEPPVVEEPVAEETAEQPVAEAPADDQDAPEEPAQPEAAAETPNAAEATLVAPAEDVAQAAEDTAAQEDEGEPDEEPAPRVKPSVPGAHLEVDIVPEGVDPLAPERPEDPYATEEDEEPKSEQEQEEGQLTEPISSAAIDLAAGARYKATGKRKTAIARVVLRPGSGTYLVNGRALDEHFPRVTLQRNIRQPLETVGYQERMDVVARLHGGGISAQAGALRHGISRALLEADPNLRGELKRRGFLTRDSRAKERKKAGLKKARKRPQFSKR
jgi:small subunit ribosomal protein S9